MFFYVITSFLEEGIAFFDPIYTTPMNNEEFFITFGASLVLGITLLFLAHRYHGIKPNYVFAGIALLLFVSNAIAVLNLGTFVTVDSGYAYSIEATEKVRQICSSSVEILAIYTVFAIVPKMVTGSHDWDIYFFGVVALAFVSVIFSYATEGQIYKDFFNPDIPFTGWNVPMSFLNNRNSYGVVLLLGIVCSAYLSIKNHHWLYFALVLFFFLNELVVMSKTTLIASAICYGIFLIWAYCSKLKDHPVKANLSLAFFITAIITALCLYFLGTSEALKGYQKFLSGLFDTMHDVGEMTFAARVDIWKHIIANVTSTNFTLVFGFGDKNFEPILGLIMFGPDTGPFYAHNGFLDVLGRNGLVGLAIYISMLVYAVVLIIKDFKGHHTTAFVSALLLLALLIHGMAESTSLMYFTSKDAIFLFLLFAPLLTDAYYDSKKDPGRINIASYTEGSLKREKRRFAPVDVLKTAFFCITPVAVGIIGFSRMIFTMNMACVFDNRLSLSITLALWILTPYLFYESSLVAIKASRGGGIAFYVASLLFTIASFAIVVTVSDPIVLYFVIIFGALLALLFSVPLWGKKGPFVCKGCLYSLVYIAAGLLIILIDHYVGYTIVVGQDNRYAAYILIVLDFALYGLAFLASPLNKNSLGIVAILWDKLERAYFYLLMHRHFYALRRDEKSFHYKRPTPNYPD